MSSAHEPWSTRVGAALATLAVLCLLARILWQVPETGAGSQARRLTVRWLPRENGAPLAAPSPAPEPVRRAALPAVRTVAPLATPRPPPQALPTPAVATPVPGAAPGLYGRLGEIALPDGIVGEARTRGHDEQVFEHRDELATGVGERATAGLFSKRPAGPGQSGKERWLYGDDIQPAEARRPPPVAFDPTLHERPSDLGSAATGDAYKAAPVRHVPVPGLGGEASRGLRAAIGELERRYPACSSERRARWLATALQHLEALERVEYRYRHGADPVEAQHTLPAAADSAHDLARRALWEAERQMKTCG
ncbi:hypothetical protein [Stenotrophomonas mori]|uniref:Uncharacterized protein n=1 Tax=Stenotrophomonas mori TaxID=2871096 RepID=A0ABT0SJ19_9GAMM|nr:hypothetical protein [Stenotrophomonas mori]MCL7715323.1 hypothetical protein [Stenotrophomonas mori]